MLANSLSWIQSDWEASSDEEDGKPAPIVAAAPTKKKGSVKAKIAEKEAQRAARLAAGEIDDIYEEDEVLDPREKARQDREREINADLANAVELLSGTTINGPAKSGSSELDSLVSANPKTREDFQEYSKNIVEFLIKKHQHKPLYATFVELHVRELATPLKDVEVRKAASGLTTLANEKQKEQRDKLSGKKKPKAAAKPGLGSVKAGDKYVNSLCPGTID